MSDEPRTAPPPPILRKETVTVPSLGEVIVRAIKLSERLALRDPEVSTSTAEALAPQAAAADPNRFIPRLLAIAVSDRSGRPLYTVDEWDIYGAQNMADVNTLAGVAMRLGGFDGVAAKNG